MAEMFPFRGPSKAPLQEPTNNWMRLFFFVQEAGNKKHKGNKGMANLYAHLQKKELQKILNQFLVLFHTLLPNKRTAGSFMRPLFQWSHI